MHMTMAFWINGSKGKKVMEVNMQQRTHRPTEESVEDGYTRGRQCLQPKTRWIDAYQRDLKSTGPRAY